MNMKQLMLIKKTDEKARENRNASLLSTNNQKRSLDSGLNTIINN